MSLMVTLARVRIVLRKLPRIVDSTLRLKGAR